MFILLQYNKPLKIFFCIMMINEQLSKMKDLMHRLDNPYGKSPLTEAIAERNVKTADEFFDILDDMHGGKFMCLGYVTGANLNVPKVQRRNPETNRMKGYANYSVFAEGEEEIGAVVKVTTYNYQWQTRESVKNAYSKYKTDANAIHAKYGLDPIGDKPQDWKSKQTHGEHGVEVYSGNDEKKFGNTYNPQNTKKARKKSHTYAIGTDGHIIREIPEETLLQYLVKRQDSKAVKQLKAMNAEEERIAAFIKEIDDLGMEYRNFESSSVLFIAATVNGEKLVFLNDRLQRCVEGINIAPEDFLKIARERYNIDVEQTMP